MTEDLTWTLSPHGKHPRVAQWVVDTHKAESYQHEGLRVWVEASQQILDNWEE